MNTGRRAFIRGTIAAGVTATSGCGSLTTGSRTDWLDSLLIQLEDGESPLYGSHLTNIKSHIVAGTVADVKFGVSYGYEKLMIVVVSMNDGSVVPEESSPKKYYYGGAETPPFTIRSPGRYEVIAADPSGVAINRYRLIVDPDIADLPGGEGG